MEPTRTGATSDADAPADRMADLVRTLVGESTAVIPLKGGHRWLQPGDMRQRIDALDSKALFSNEVDVFMDEIIVERERRLRAWVAAGWTQQRIAEEVGRDQSTVSRWMKKLEVAPSQPHKKLCVVHNSDDDAERYAALRRAGVRIRVVAPEGSCGVNELIRKEKLDSKKPELWQTLLDRGYRIKVEETPAKEVDDNVVPIKPKAKDMLWETICMHGPDALARVDLDAVAAFTDKELKDGIKMLTQGLTTSNKMRAALKEELQSREARS